MKPASVVHDEAAFLFFLLLWSRVVKKSKLSPGAEAVNWTLKTIRHVS